MSHSLFTKPEEKQVSFIIDVDAFTERNGERFLSANATVHLEKPYGLVREFSLTRGEENVVINAFHNGPKQHRVAIFIPKNAPWWTLEAVKQAKEQLCQY